MWKIMNAENNAQITLTESLAMDPPASVCGLYIAHPHSKYFAVGKIAVDQVYSYMNSLQVLHSGIIVVIMLFRFLIMLFANR